MTFGERLKELREGAGMTQDALAEASGVPLSTIRGYEQSKRIPVFGAIIRMAQALGTDCRSFADCEDVNDERGTPAKKPAADRRSKK